MTKRGEDYKVRAEMPNCWVNADFADIAPAQKWAIDYLCKGALLVEILDPSGEVVETLKPEWHTEVDFVDKYDEGDIADLLDEGDIADLLDLE